MIIPEGAIAFFTTSKQTLIASEGVLRISHRRYVDVIGIDQSQRSLQKPLAQCTVYPTYIIGSLPFTRSEGESR